MRCKKDDYQITLFLYKTTWYLYVSKLIGESLIILICVPKSQMTIFNQALIRHGLFFYLALLFYLNFITLKREIMKIL
jgi:hypothetical protein